MQKASAFALALFACALVPGAQSGVATHFIQPGFDFSGDPRAISSADLDGNGYLDLVIADASNAGLQVRRQCSPGAFFEALRLADRDSDGNLDVLVVQSDLGVLGVLMGLGYGLLGPEATFRARSWPGILTLVTLQGCSMPRMFAYRVMSSMPGSVIHRES